MGEINKISKGIGILLIVMGVLSHNISQADQIDDELEKINQQLAEEANKNLPPLTFHELIKSTIDYAVLMHPSVQTVGSDLKKQTINFYPLHLDAMRILLYKSEALSFANLNTEQALKIYDETVAGEMAAVNKIAKLTQKRLGRLAKQFSSIQKRKEQIDPKMLSLFNTYRKAGLPNSKEVIRVMGIEGTLSEVVEKVGNNWPGTQSEMGEKLMLILSQISFKYSEIFSNLRSEELFKLAARDLVETLDHDLTETDLEDIVYRAFVASAISSLDPHSELLSNQQSMLFMRRMTYFQPLGISFLNHTRGVLVSKVIAGSAADMSGLKRGDILLKVEKQNLKSLDDMETHLAFTPYDQFQYVTVSVLRENKKLTIKIDRSLAKEGSREDPIDFDIATSGNIRVGVLKFDSFGHKYSDIIKEILEINKNNIDGLIIDLRFNPGGALPEATRLAYLFQDLAPIPQHTVWTMRNPKDGPLPPRSNIDNMDMDTEFHPILPTDFPLVVLVNEASASASEVLSGTLKIHGKAIIVGSKNTFGKGSVQQLLPEIIIEGRGAQKIPSLIKITKELYFLSDGSTPQFVGVQSDIPIKGSFEVPHGKRERDLPNAIAPFPLDYNPLTFHFYPSKLPVNVEALKAQSLERQSSWTDENDPEKNEKRILDEAAHIVADWIDAR